MSDDGWIGVDLDGTLAKYDTWQGPEYIGAPIPAMVERVKGWIAEGKDVRIFTARVTGANTARGETDRDLERVREVIQAWCAEHIGKVLPITNVKDFGLRELWDDRCVQVEQNTGRSVAARLQKAEAALTLLYMRGGLDVSSYLLARTALFEEA